MSTARIGKYEARVKNEKATLGAENGKNGTVPLWVAASHRVWRTESRLCVPLRAMSAPHRCNYAFRRYLLEKPGTDRGREQGLCAQCRQRQRGPFSFLPELRQQRLLRVRQIPRRMRNSSRYLRRSGLCVPDLLSLRGVDASLGQIAVRNRSFPESPTRDEPLIRHYFCTALLQCMSPLLAQSGRRKCSEPCPLLGVKRTSSSLGRMSAVEKVGNSA